jgi:peptide/nickel transport system ATP-binding protein
MVYQEPASVLNAVRRMGPQVADVIQAQFRYNLERCRRLALHHLAEVHLDNPEAIYSAYPHELSGGQRQRIVLAQAFAREPSLIVADEPTAALDTVIQTEVLKVMQTRVAAMRTSMVLITHDPLILFGLADRIIHIHRGVIIEEHGAEHSWSTVKDPCLGSALE